MSKLGITKKFTPVQFEPDTTNVAGGTAFEVKNASQRLLNIVGAPGFNEPRAYYNIPDTHIPEVARKFSGSYGSLTGAAKVIVDTAFEVAMSDSPRDLVAIAHWARKEGHCRQTPLVLLAVAAKCPKTKEFVRAYCQNVISRADELVGMYAAYRYLFGKPIPSALLKGIRDSFGKFNEYHLIKYNQPDKTPNFKDVLLQMPNRRAGRPVSRGMAEFLINGRLVDKDGRDFSETAPLVAAHLKLLEFAKENKTFNDEASRLAEEAKATWEVIISLFGSNKTTWNSVFPRMGYMALLRNMRNLISKGVDADKIAERIADRKAVLRSKQYPFRFLAASREIGKTPLSVKDKKVLLDALSQALEHSVENVGEIPGDTLIFVDCSGSMMSRVSGKSTMSCLDAAACMAAILSKACRSAYIYAFGSECVLLDVRKTDSVTTIIDKVMGANRQVGNATYAYKPFYEAVRGALKADRIVLLSDMQCYSAPVRFYSDSQRNRAGERTVQTGLSQYKGLNRDVWLHSVNLNAHDASAQVESDGSHVNLVSGFSTKILSTLLEAEGAEEVPTLEYIRKNF